MYLEVYSGGEEVESEDCFDGGCVGGVWSSVVRVEGAPVLEVGDGLFDGPAEFVDRGVVVSGFLGDFLAGSFLFRGDHSASGVALVGDELGGVSSLEEPAGVDRGHVMSTAG